MNGIYKVVKTIKNSNGLSTATVKINHTKNGLFTLPVYKIVKNKKLLAKFDSDDMITLIQIATIENNTTTNKTNITKTPKFLNLFLMLFVTTMIASNIGSSKLASVFGITITGGIFSFCTSYVIADIVNEVYGYKNVRQLIWYGLICNIIMSALLELSIKLPPSQFWHNQESFALVLGSVPRILIASLVSYTCSEFINSYILTKLKNKQEFILLRLFKSTFFGITTDTFLFTFIGFFGVLPINELLFLAIKIYLCKSMFEYLLIYPTYQVIQAIKNREKLDILDYNTNLTPFSLDNSYNNSNNIYERKPHS